MEQDTRSIVYLIAILILIVLVGILLIKFSVPIEVDVSQNIDRIPPLYDGEIEEWLVVAGRFAKYHEYNRTSYNCVNYSTDLKAIADSLGFRTKIVRGYVDGNDTGHEWLKLEVDFEPQHGTFVDYSLDYPNQKDVSGYD